MKADAYEECRPPHTSARQGCPLVQRSQSARCGTPGLLRVRPVPQVGAAGPVGSPLVPTAQSHVLEDLGVGMKQCMFVSLFVYSPFA